jgi:hypothetical protein
LNDRKRKDNKNSATTTKFNGWLLNYI